MRKNADANIYRVELPNGKRVLMLGSPPNSPHAKEIKGKRVLKDVYLRAGANYA